MCPGRFPSPTPSREASPILSVRRHTGSPGSPSRVSKHRSASLNFTAPITCRKRPRFSDAQSEPKVSLSSNHIPPTTPRSQSTIQDGRRVSDPLPHRTPRPRSPTTNNEPVTPITPQLVNVKLHQKLSEALTSRDKRGVVYILRDPARPERGFKIGSTTVPDYRTRINEHAHDCFFTPTVVSTPAKTEYCRRVEKLAQIDLEGKCRRWVCDDHAKQRKSVEHREWFTVSEEVAKETVQKWAKFMNEQQPYDWRRKLSPLWSHLLRTRRLDNNVDQDARREQWHSILAVPTYLDYYHFTVDTLVRLWCATLDILLYIWPHFTRLFWQMLTVTYGFVTLVAFRNTFASSAFALVSVCACISVAQPKFLRRMRAKS